MQTTVKKWGNSLALRIPRAFAEEMTISADSPVEVSVVEGKLVVAPVGEPELTLEELLSRVTEENLHREVDTGAAVGNEVW